MKKLEILGPIFLFLTGAYFLIEFFILRNDMLDGNPDREYFEHTVGAIFYQHMFIGLLMIFISIILLFLAIRRKNNGG